MKHMRLNWSWQILLLLFATQMQLIAAADSIDITAQPGYIKGELIYELNNKPTPQCHASTIAEVSSGFVAAWFGGKYEGNLDVGIWISPYNGKKWTIPVEIANGVVSPSRRYPCWNPVLFMPKSGPLMLFYKVGPNPQEWWGMLMTSNDEGKTWSKPWKLGENKTVSHLIGPVKNKPIQLRDGAILCPSSSEHTGWRVHFEVTRDFGKTWEVIGPINDGKEFSAIQPSILTYPGERMQILCRSRQKVVTQSWSEDGGQTWSHMKATNIPNPNASTDAITLKDGRQLLVYNNTTKGRSPLNVAVSSDGIKWKDVLLLENQKGEFSYPAVIQDSNGRVHITYTYKRQSVKYVVIEPSQLEILEKIE
jgi:predicted neuraminidase